MTDHLPERAPLFETLSILPVVHSLGVCFGLDQIPGRTYLPIKFASLGTYLPTRGQRRWRVDIAQPGLLATSALPETGSSILQASACTQSASPARRRLKLDIHIYASSAFRRAIPQHRDGLAMHRDVKHGARGEHGPGGHHQIRRRQGGVSQGPFRCSRVSWSGGSI